MWMFMILAQIRLLCFVILARLNAVVKFPTELGSGTIPMELKWELLEGLKQMNFIEIEEHKSYASIVEMA